MIDVKQLRIGSIVANKHGFQFEVVGIFKDQILCDFKGNEGDVFEFKPSEVFGVPLTEERLVKVGFEKFEAALITSYHKIVKCTHAELEELSICKNDEGTWYVYFRQGSQTSRDNYHLNDLVQLSNKLEYVHQLQNLVLDLSGTELELKTIQPETRNK